MMTEIKPEQLLDLYWDKWELPINSYKIAEKAGIEIKHLDDKNTTLCGRFCPATKKGNGEEGPARIEYNRNDSINEQRFTIAHELDHCFLEHGASNREAHNFSDSKSSLNITNLNPNEAKANDYALRLLIPKNYVDYLYWGRGITNYKKLANIFGVSDIAIKFRLMMLNILRS